MMLTLERRRNRACANCYYLKIEPDNLDPYRLGLLAKLEGGEACGGCHARD
jgi:hypothetical protein